MLILASQSPRRRDMLTAEKLAFKIIPADVDETPLPDEAPDTLVKRLAEHKARHVAAQYPDDVVLAADTIVAYQHHTLGKPEDMDDARKMMEILSGNAHQVYTGVCIYHAASDRSESWIATTDVVFKELDAATIDHYLTISEPLDKAGGYAIQEHQDLLVDHFEGLYSNVVGLPIEEVMEKLSEFGVIP